MVTGNMKARGWNATDGPLGRYTSRTMWKISRFSTRQSLTVMAAALVGIKVKEDRLPDCAECIRS